MKFILAKVILFAGRAYISSLNERNAPEIFAGIITPILDTAGITVAEIFFSFTLSIDLAVLIKLLNIDLALVWITFAGLKQHGALPYLGDTVECA